jgi:hypothetical protein
VGPGAELGVALGGTLGVALGVALSVAFICIECDMGHRHAMPGTGRSGAGLDAEFGVEIGKRIPQVTALESKAMNKIWVIAGQSKAPGNLVRSSVRHLASSPVHDSVFFSVQDSVLDSVQDSVLDSAWNSVQRSA